MNNQNKRDQKNDKEDLDLKFGVKQVSCLVCQYDNEGCRRQHVFHPEKRKGAMTEGIVH